MAARQVRRPKAIKAPAIPVECKRCHKPIVYVPNAEYWRRGLCWECSRKVNIEWWNREQRRLRLKAMLDELP